MHVSDEQVIEEIVTSPCCSSTLSAVSNSSERENKQVAPDWASHEEREKVKDTAIGIQHDVTSRYPAISEKPNQPRHFNFPRRHFGTLKIVGRSFLLAILDVT